MKRIFGLALGILTAIGGFVDIGDLVTNAVVGSRFGLRSPGLWLSEFLASVSSLRCRGGWRQSAAVQRSS